MSIILLAILSALIASILGAFAGGGMALVMIPLLLLFIPEGYLSAFTLTKLSGFTMTLVGCFVHHKKHKISTKLAGVLVTFGLIGTALGTYVLEVHLNEALFEKLLGIFLILMSIYLIQDKKIGILTIERKITNKLLVETALVITGLMFIGGVIGGAGVLMTLYLVLRFKMSYIKASAYTMGVNFLTITAQSAYLVPRLDLSVSLIAAVAVGGVLGGYIGTKLQYLKGSKWIKIAAISVMLVIGVQSLFF